MDETEAPLRSHEPGSLPWDTAGRCPQETAVDTLPPYHEAALEAWALDEEGRAAAARAGDSVARQAFAPTGNDPHRYLIVAHQTAESSELHQRVIEIGGRDSRAEFTLLVPATPIEITDAFLDGGYLGLERAATEAWSRASRTAWDASKRLATAGVRITRVVVGDASPFDAIEDELRERPGEYEALVICNLPPGLSRWLRMDLPRRAERRFRLPTVHVAANSLTRVAV